MRVALYYRTLPEGDRWFKGDRHPRKYLRRAIRGPARPGGVDRVYLNLRAGLEQLGIDCVTNLPYAELTAGDHVGVIGRGPGSLLGYTARNPVVTGVAVAAHPSEWPTLFDDYPVAYNLVHTAWVKAMYDPWYGDERVLTWPVGIDTAHWSPTPAVTKTVDYLVYDKILWEGGKVREALQRPILEELRRRNLSYEVIRYGAYRPDEFEAKLRCARALLFMCEHESQGLAYQQAMSAGLPVLAWDPGQWLDPMRYGYGENFVPASSVPLFDARCGLRFQTIADFPEQLDLFVEGMNAQSFQPRDFVQENLTLAGCAQRYVNILKEVNS